MPDLTRRDFVKVAVGVGAAAAAAATGGLLYLAATDGQDGAPQGRVLVRKAKSQEPLRVGALDGTPPVQALGEAGGVPVLLLKVPAKVLEASSRLRGYNTAQHALQHPTEAGMMVLAYDARCTHLGCTVAFAPSLGASTDHADYDGDGHPDGRFLCPCHQSQFDAFDLGHEKEGVPARKPLGVMRLTLAPLQPGETDAAGLAFWSVERLGQETYRDADRAAPKPFGPA